MKTNEQTTTTMLQSLLSVRIRSGYKVHGKVKITANARSRGIGKANAEAAYYGDEDEFLSILTFTSTLPP